MNESGMSLVALISVILFLLVPVLQIATGIIFVKNERIQKRSLYKLAKIFEILTIESIIAGMLLFAALAIYDFQGACIAGMAALIATFVTPLIITLFE
jgi:hypothetical protein